MEETPLLLVPLGVPGPEPAILHRLARGLSLARRAECAVAEPLPHLATWCDPMTGRLSSNRLVDSLVQRFPDAEGPRPHWVLGVIDADLSAPQRDFVFGEATLGGNWAVVALHRLRPDTTDSEALLDARLLTEAIHELGHLAGLSHCSRPDCVMYPSCDVADTDRKGPRFCAECRLVASAGRP